LQRICVLAVLAALCWSGRLSAQTPEVVLRGGTQEVLLDFVVRDKHQKFVKDLRPEDVQIFEDGVPQKMRSFSFRDGRNVANSASGNKTGSALNPNSSDPLRQINLVTLVFEAMSPLSRRTAVERAHEFIKTETGPNTWIGVYSLRYQLAVLQPYTTDLTLLNKAVERAGTGAYQQFAKESLQIVERINSLQATGLAAQQFQPFNLGSAEERGPQNDVALAKAELQMQGLILKTLFRQEGTRSIDALRTLIREQARLPGRKTVLLFSEGLIIPPGQTELLDSVIGEANRANVSFYTVDARGLTNVSNVRVSQALSAAMADADSVNSTDLQANARRLAERTGGFAMDNSNDLRGPLQRVMEDVRSHYEVTYAPRTDHFDGHFRKVEVRLGMRGLKVQSRAGYYALPLVNGETIAPYEMAALNAINMQPSPNSFPYTAGVLRFGADPTRGVDCRIVFAVPGSSLKFQNDPATQSFQIHLSVLGLVKDEQGQVVAKVANDLPFRAPIGKQENFAEGKVTLALPLHLPPGHYQLQTAVIDREADRASVKRSVLIVPAGGTQSLGVSDIVWVRDLAPKSTLDAANVLSSSEGEITPELAPVLASGGSAAFYFVTYPPLNARDKPEAQITVESDGKTLTSSVLAAPAPDASGAYRYSVTLPLAQFSPGDYQLNVTVSQNGMRTTKEALFQVR